MKYFKITHDIFGDENDQLFTFKGEGERKIGDIVLCKTCRGNRLGKIVSIEENSSFKPTASIIKLNAGRKRNLLSAYDKATLKVAEGGNIEEALSFFNGYSDYNQVTAFLYKVGGYSNVRWTINSFWYTKEVSVYEDAYDADGNWDGERLSFTYNFG